MSDLSVRLSKCYASAIHDVLRELGYGNCVLPPEIQALERGQKLAGEIYTISGGIDQTLSRHESLLLWSQVLSKVPGGKVLICQPNTHAVALMGELSARALMVKGTKGYLMDGHCRDVEEIIDAGFSVFCRLATPADIVERWRYNSLGNPITIGTVTIRSGDYIIADMDGAVIIPQEVIEDVVSKTEDVMATESEMRLAILDGMDPEEAYLKFRKF
ncbi:RraA family protein [Alphaproteobacteria bacterium]|jgi:4-hydroxy-4-methyl-2-oxoglutarate aldolase|nr:RraA family protein [Alphaproteobacteria bacterium]|tara:strand:- start:803 stop:1450 length:648 start_codon:yes stop_codon:yes gene_type:complete